MKKKHVQKCNIGGSSSSAGKRSTGNKGKKSKDVVEVYNKFYKDQVAALYRAVLKNK